MRGVKPRVTASQRIEAQAQYRSIPRGQRKPWMAAKCAELGISENTLRRYLSSYSRWANHGDAA